MALALLALVATLTSVTSAQEPVADPDLIKLGQSILPDNDPAPVRAAARHDAAAADAGAEDAESDAAAEPDASEEPDAAPAMAAEREAADDAGSATAVDPVASAKVKASTGSGAPVALGPDARQARIDSGQNLALASIAESPLAMLGVPPQAVPAVATTATVGVMAFWPLITKTLLGLFKSLFGAFIKVRAKKGKTIDKKQKSILVMGFVIRPAEILALLLGALTYGLGVCYAFQGRQMSTSFLLTQEALVIAIYYARSFVRLAYERAFKLPTQFKFWPAGGLLCLASAYLGNTLGTVGYEVEETTTPEDAERIVKMKAWLIALSLGMALAFFAANVLWPMKILQSGRVMMSGVALAEILPITPMPGMKIFKWKKAVWVLLVVAVVPTFALINFVL